MLPIPTEASPPAKPQTRAAATNRFSAWHFLSRLFSQERNNALWKLFRTMRPDGGLHRRRQPVAADADAVGFEGTVRQLLHRGDHLGAGLEIGFDGRHIGHHRRIGRYRDFLL